MEKEIYLWSEIALSSVLGSATNPCDLGQSAKFLFFCFLFFFNLKSKKHIPHDVVVISG